MSAAKRGRPRHLGWPATMGWWLALALMAPTPGAPQTPAATEGPPTDPVPARTRVGCLHGSPLPICRSFWIVELQASTTLASPKRLGGVEPYRFQVDEGGDVYEWNLGHMTNLDDRWAVGGVVSLGSGTDDIFTGVRGRLRRWVGEHASVELEAGIARYDGNHSWYPSQTGVTVGTRLNVQDYGSVFVRYDGYGEPDPQPWMQPGDAPEGGARHFLRGGVGLGGKAALAGTGAVMVAYAVLLGLFLAGGGSS